ncbi:MAG: carboxylesterase family protein [Thermoguttaceae bacterium]
MRHRLSAHCVGAVFFLLLVISSPAARCEPLPVRTYTEPGTGKELQYGLYTPINYDPTQDYPLVLYLHGAGPTQVYTGIYSDVPAHVQSSAYNGFLFAPLAPASDYSWFSYDDAPSVGIRMVLSVLSQLENEFPSIDTTRLYVTGPSMGGGGTWDIIWRRPGMFAAAVPVCGYNDIRRAPLLVDQPIWAFHAADDPVVPVQYDRDMIAAIRDLGGNPLYTEYPTGGHSIGSRVYADNSMWDWMYSQQTPEPSSLALALSGIAALGCYLTWKRSKKANLPNSV